MASLSQKRLAADMESTRLAPNKRQRTMLSAGLQPLVEQSLPWLEAQFRTLLKCPSLMLTPGLRLSTQGPLRDNPTKRLLLLESQELIVLNYATCQLEHRDANNALIFAQTLLPDKLQEYHDAIDALAFDDEADLSETEFIRGKAPSPDELDLLLAQESFQEPPTPPSQLEQSPPASLTADIDPSLFQEDYIPSPSPAPVRQRPADYSFKPPPFEWKLNDLSINKTRSRLATVCKDWGKHFGYARRGGRIYEPHPKYGRYYMECADYNGESSFEYWFYRKIPDDVVGAIGMTNFGMKHFKKQLPLYFPNPRKILFRNGVLDIGTVKLTPLKEGYKGQPCGHFMDCDWLPRGEGTCANFDRLMTTQGFDNETVMWILALMGRSLFGVQDNWQIAGYLFGPGGTGKSTLLKYITSWMPVQAKRTIAGSTGGSDFDSFDHNDGIRLVVYDELTRLTKLRADRLRALVSGDSVELNRKHKGQTVGQFTGSIWFSGNEIIDLGNSPNAKDATDRRFAMIQMVKKPSGPIIKDSMIQRETQVVLRKALMCYHHINRQISDAAYRYLPPQLATKASNVKDQWSTFNGFLDNALRYEEGSRARLDYIIRDWGKVARKTGCMDVMEKVNISGRKKAINLWLKHHRSINKPGWKRTTVRDTGKTANVYVLMDHVLDTNAASIYSDDFNHEAEDNRITSNKKLYCLSIAEL